MMDALKKFLWTFLRSVWFIVSSICGTVWFLSASWSGMENKYNVANARMDNIEKRQDEFVVFIRETNAENKKHWEKSDNLLHEMKGKIDLMEIRGR